MVETLLSLVVVLIVVGVCFWLFISYVLPAIPMPEPFRAAVIAILAIIVILLLLSWVLPGLHFRAL